jgi:hypothetical protein
VWKFDFHSIFLWNVLNVWKYGNLCENLTFIRYLCEICSMCENMAICVKNEFYWIFVWNMLNVWKYDHLMTWFCFWSVCSFWSVVLSFWWTLHWMWQLFSFWWRKRETHSYDACLSSQEKRDTLVLRASPISVKGRHMIWGHISLLLNCIKKIVNKKFSIGRL